MSGQAREHAARLAAIRERLEAAEEEGWYGYDEEARADVRYLLDAREQAEQALRFYAEETTWDDEGRAWRAVGPPENCEADEDRGSVARAALAASGGTGQ